MVANLNVMGFCEINHKIKALASIVDSVFLAGSFKATGILPKYNYKYDPLRT